MTNVLNVSEPRNLHELSWDYAQDGKAAFGYRHGDHLDVNPAMEALTGYPRAELIGMHVTMLHPESEHELVEAEFRKATLRASPHFGYTSSAKMEVWRPSRSVVGEAEAARPNAGYWRVPRYDCDQRGSEASGEDGGQISWPS